MKALILVDSISSIPPKQRSGVLVVTQLNWQETFFYLEGKTSDQYLFLHENCPCERLLKVFEDYKGNLAVYTSRVLDPVILSRFTTIVNRRKVSINPNFGIPSDLQKEFLLLKKRF